MFSMFVVVLIWWGLGMSGLLIGGLLGFVRITEMKDYTIGDVFEDCGYAFFGPLIFIIVIALLWEKTDWSWLSERWDNAMNTRVADTIPKPKQPPAKKEEVKFTNHQPTYDRMQEIKNRKPVSSEEATLKSNLLED